MKYNVVCKMLVLIGVLSLVGPLATFAADSNRSDAERIDMQAVYQQRMTWNNDLRSGMKLPDYTFHEALQTTAGERSLLAQQRGEITHKRNPKKDAYYDYKKIERRFADRNVYFKNINRSTFSESIGWGTYRCSGDDCTQSLITAIRSTRDFFYKEKNKQYQPHYKALVHPRFSHMGIGIVLDEVKKKYYLTVHYGTEVYQK